MRSRGLGRLGAEFRGLELKRSSLLLGVGSLLLAALLVGGTLALVVLPAHVVDVDGLAVGVEVEDAVDGLADEFDIVADHDEAAGVVLQELAQPDDGVGVEVVGRLVEDHRAGIREQDARELDAASLAARERLQLLVEDAVRQVQVAGDGCGLGFGRVTAEHMELLLEPPILLHRGCADPGVLARHVVGRLVHPEHDAAESSGVEDARTGQVFRVAGARILRQVADLFAAVHSAAGRQGLPRQHLGECGLAGAVAPDETDLVTVGDAEVHPLHEESGTHSELKVMHTEHRRHPILSSCFHDRG